MLNDSDKVAATGKHKKPCISCSGSNPGLPRDTPATITMRHHAVKGVKEVKNNFATSVNS
jgi:hypothetical protein